MAEENSVTESLRESLRKLRLEVQEFKAEIEEVKQHDEEVMGIVENQINDLRQALLPEDDACSNATNQLHNLTSRIESLEKQLSAASNNSNIGSPPMAPRSGKESKRKGANSTTATNPNPKRSRAGEQQFSTPSSSSGSKSNSGNLSSSDTGNFSSSSPRIQKRPPLVLLDDSTNQSEINTSKNETKEDQECIIGNKRKAANVAGEGTTAAENRRNSSSFCNIRSPSASSSVAPGSGGSGNSHFLTSVIGDYHGLEEGEVDEYADSCFS